MNLDSSFERTKGNIKIVLLSAFTLITLNLFSQQTVFNEQDHLTYVVVNPKSVSDISIYVRAMNKANFNYHRLKSSRNVITFEGGLQIELFSAKEIIENGVVIDESHFQDIIPNYIPPVFKLADNDFIIEQKQMIYFKEH